MDIVEVDWLYSCVACNGDYFDNRCNIVVYYDEELQNIVEQIYATDSLIRRKTLWHVGKVLTFF